jgi:hypothetical protein
MPRMGKKLKMPPRMRSTAMARRTANEDGIRNQRMNRETPIGTRRSIISKYLFNSAFVYHSISLGNSCSVAPCGNVWIAQRSLRVPWRPHYLRRAHHPRPTFAAFIRGAHLRNSGGFGPAIRGFTSEANPSIRQEARDLRGKLSLRVRFRKTCDVHHCAPF